MSTATTQPTIKFEEALADLERILRDLEDGNATLEESLERYERGVTLLRTCHKHLNEAEQKIRLLTGVTSDGKAALENFEHTSAAARQQARKAQRSESDD
jgi:exodeoxyribonuclease VII small subunit